MYTGHDIFKALMLHNDVNRDLREVAVHVILQLSSEDSARLVWAPGIHLLCTCY